MNTSLSLSPSGRGHKLVPGDAQDGGSSEDEERPEEEPADPQYLLNGKLLLTLGSWEPLKHTGPPGSGSQVTFPRKALSQKCMSFPSVRFQTLLVLLLFASEK